MGQVDAIPFSDSWLLQRVQVRCLWSLWCLGEVLAGTQTLQI